MPRDLQQDAVKFERSLRHFIHGWHREYEAALSGIAASHFRAMTVLKESGPLPMGDVAKALGATLGGATGFVDRAVSTGLAVREYDPSDRRIVRVRLTPKGVETTERIEGLMVTFVRKALGGLTDSERVSLLDLWGKIAGDVEQT